MSRKKIMVEKKRKIGIFGGRFTPLHNGHVGAILRAAEYVDTLYVVLSYSEKDPIKGHVRLKWMNAVFSPYSNIKILYVKRDKILESVGEWLRDSENIRIEIWRNDESFSCVEAVHVDKVFVGSNDHDDMFKICYPEAKVVVLDPLRSDITISGTEIRNNIYSNWEYLPKFVRKDFAKIVSVDNLKLRNQLTDRFSTVKVEDVYDTYLDIYGEESITQPEIQDVIESKLFVLSDEAAYNSNRVFFVPSSWTLYFGMPDLFISGSTSLDDAIEEVKEILK